MFELVGTFARPQVSAWPWLLPALPLLFALLVWRARVVPSRRLSIAGALAPVAAALALAGRLAAFPADRRVLVHHLWLAARVSMLDVSVDARLDPAGVVLAAGAGLACAAWLLRERGQARRRRALLGLGLLGCAELAIVADGFPLLVLAWAGAAALALTLGRAQAPAFVADRVADAALLFGAIALFWVLGGTFTAQGYAPDLDPRVVAARATPTPPPTFFDDDDDDDREALPPPVTGNAPATLTFVTLPGADVDIDDARVPLRAPFAEHALAGGLHRVRVHPGHGSDDFVLDRFYVDAGEHAALTILGSTMSFTALDAQLAAHDPSGEAFVRQRLAARTLFGLPAAWLAAAMVIVAFGARSLRERRPAVAGLAGLAAVAVVLRAAPLFAITPGWTPGFAAAFAVLSAGVATYALRFGGAGRWVSAEMAFAAFAVAVGAPAAGVLHASLVGLASTRPARVPLAVSVALFGTRLAALEAAYTQRAGVLLLVLGAVALLACTAAVHRGASRSARVPAAWAVAVLGLGLGLGPHLIAGDVPSLIQAWVLPTRGAAPLATAPAVFARAAIALLVAGLTALAVRDASRAARSGAVTAMASAVRGARVSVLAAGAAVRSLAGVAAELDERVVSGAAGAAGLLGRAAGFAQAYVDETLFEAPTERVARAAGVAVGRAMTMVLAALFLLMAFAALAPLLA